MSDVRYWWTCPTCESTDVYVTYLVRHEASVEQGTVDDEGPRIGQDEDDGDYQGGESFGCAACKAVDFTPVCVAGDLNGPSFHGTAMIDAMISGLPGVARDGEG